MPPDSPLRAVEKACYFVKTRLMLRARLLFLVPLPLLFLGLFSAFTGSGVEMLGRFGGFSLFMLAAWLLVEGQKAQVAYEEREVARPPALPRKILASLTTGAAVAVTSLFGFEPILNEPDTAGLFALLATVLHSFSFGIDPLKAKGLSGIPDYDATRLVEILELGERLIAETRQAARRFSSRTLQRQVDGLLEEARAVLRTMENDPRELPRSRKFMAVYLQGARDATVKLAALDQLERHPENVRDYEHLLQDLRQQFLRQKQALLVNDRNALEVELDVLRERIKREK
jgi:5-bromo-4-chloroindolyl phosphate hydrolysis protein